MVENLPVSIEDPGSIPWLGRFPRRRKWQPTQIFLPGRSHGPRSLAGYSPWGHKGSDTTKQLNNNNGSCVNQVWGFLCFGFFFFIFIFYWSMVELKCYNISNVSNVQQSDSVIYVSILFQNLFPFRLLQNIEFR